MGKKIVTFSIDDGDLDDRFIVETFNKHGIKGTFHLCSGRLGRIGTFRMYDTDLNTSCVTAEEIKELYKNHEVSSHTKNHKKLLWCNDDEIVDTVEGDRLILEELFGQPVIGLAYPEGGPNHDGRVVDVIKKRTNIKYARSVEDTYTFDMPADFYEWKRTSHIANPDLLNLIDKFEAEETDEDRLCLIFLHGFNLQVDGHKYGFDFTDCYKWLETVCDYLDNKGFEFMTMGEVYRYMTENK